MYTEVTLSIKLKYSTLVSLYIYAVVILCYQFTKIRASSNDYLHSSSPCRCLPKPSGQCPCCHAFYPSHRTGMVSPEPTRWNVPCRSWTCFSCHSARWLATNGTRCVMHQTKQDYTRRVWPWLNATGSHAFKSIAQFQSNWFCLVWSGLVWTGPAWSAAVCRRPQATLEYTRFESRSCYVYPDP